jgi:pimeloyl-ACP methyl ester carboxylesterase
MGPFFLGLSGSIREVLLPQFLSQGVEIHFLDEGQAGKRRWPVLLIHGFASNIDMNWVSTGWVRALTGDGYRAVALDNRGHGRSAKLYEAGDYGAAIMAGDVLRLLDHLGIAQAHVIGYSMGARIAAVFALRHPDRVRSLVFGGLGANMVRAMAGTGPIAHALLAPHIDDVINPTARTFRAFAEQTRSDLKALAACVRQIREPVAEADIRELRVPVLVAVGTQDVIAGPPEGLAQLIPGAEAFEIEGRDHMKAVGDASFKAAALGFLNRVD